MTDTAPADPRYPTGKYHVDGPVTREQREAWIGEIEQLPARFRAAVRGLSDEQLDTPYRDGGWTLRQLIHHVADSHMNAYIRLKLALTEANPTIKPYDEAAWADLPDTAGTPPEVSLALLDALHTRWTVLLRSITDEQWSRSMRHPERGDLKLDYATGMYAWHGRHHTAHAAGLRERKGW